MRPTVLVLLLVAAVAAHPAAQSPAPLSGEALVHAMHARYDGAWYRTLTFVQKTIHPDGRVETWYEAARLPGRLRIDIAPLDSGNAVIFRNDSIYQFQRGVLQASRPTVHPLMVLGFDVYSDPPDRTVARLRGLNFDLARIRDGTWQGRPVWIVGAAEGDERTNQFWIDQERLVFVRMLRSGAQGNVSETRFNRYFEVGGGWIAPEVLFFANGVPGIVEEYSDIRTGMELPDELFDPGRFARPARVK